MKRSATLWFAAGALAITAIAVAWFLLCYKPRSDLRQCEENLRVIEAAVGMYACDSGGTVPGGRMDLTRAECARWLARGLVPGYLKAMPTCPAAGRDTYSDGYRQDNFSPNGGTMLDMFTLRCRGRFHMAAGAPPDFPASDSPEGMLQPARSSEPRQSLPESLEVDGVSLRDDRATVTKKFKSRCPPMEPYGLNDDETFLPTVPTLIHTIVLLDTIDRVKMVRGTQLTCVASGSLRTCRTMEDVSSALGPPHWTVGFRGPATVSVAPTGEVLDPSQRTHEFLTGYRQWIYDSHGVNLTLIGRDAPFCVTLTRVSHRGPVFPIAPGNWKRRGPRNSSCRRRGRARNRKGHPSHVR